MVDPNNTPPPGPPARTPHGRRWEQVNPADHKDGVLYLPAMVELQPRQPDWGHPGMRERVNDDRPHGVNGERLLCLLCMRLRSEQHLPPAPVWLTYANGPYRPTFRHADGRSPHAEHEPETDVHKALKERKARTWQAAGAVDVDVEVWRPRARRRPDVLAVGPKLTVAGEVQHSRTTARIVGNRQRSLRKAGDRVLWTTDRHADSIAFLHQVPHLSVPNLADWRQYLIEPRLEVGAGAITFESQRCGWADLWSGTQRCPVTGRSVPCGRVHLYPSFLPREYNRTPSAVNARFPCGPRMHLDHMLEGVLHGSWVPYQHRTRVTWIPADVADAVEAERGQGVKRAEAGVVRRRRDEDAERACERRIPEQRSPLTQPAVGVHGWWLASGKPMHPGCAACRRAPGGPDA